MNEQETFAEKKNTGPESLHILLRSWRDGTFSEILDDWKWILAYTRRFRRAAAAYTVLGIAGATLSLVSALASKHTIDIITGYDSSRLWFVLTVMVLSALSSLLLRSVTSRISTKISLWVNNDIQAEVFDRLLAAEERLHSAIQELRGSMRPRITAELCLLDLCRVEGSTLAALSARIEQLERQLAGGVMPVYQQAPVNAQPAPAVAVHQPTVQEDFAVAAQQQIVQQTPAADQMQAAKPAPAKRPAAKAQPQPAADTLAAAVNAAPKPKSAKVQQTEEYAGDFAAGEDFWKQALEIMKAEKKNSMVSCAKNGRVFSFANNILQVAFKAPFLADRMNKDDYRKAFEEVLLRLARREIRLEAVIEGKAKLPQPPVKQQEVQQSPESETQNLQAAQLPENLRKAFNALGGSVTDISDQ